MEELKKHNRKSAANTKEKNPQLFLSLVLFFYSHLKFAAMEAEGGGMGCPFGDLKDAGFPRLCRRKQPLILEINTEVIQRGGRLKISSSGPSSKTQTAGAEQLQEG